MESKARISLRNKHLAVLSPSNDKTPPQAVARETRTGESYAPEKQLELLQPCDAAIIKKAWFTKSHLLLDPGSRVVDMGCGDGAMTYAMAVLNPDIHFIGVDQRAKAVNKARKDFQIPNLEFISDNAGKPSLPENSFDAVVDSFILHEIYSVSRCNYTTVEKALERHFALLKQDGLLFIRDNPMPPQEEMVLIEMPDEPRGPNDEPRELDLLLDYSERARSRQSQEHCGFYLEELPARFPRTRLFRLPAKWAHEFILHKDDRANWEEELQKEYTYYTPRDYRRALRSLGARVLYSAPHWDDHIVKSSFEKHFKLLDESGKSLGPPATSFIVLAQKIGDRRSLTLSERRPSRKEKSEIRVTAMRDEVTGKIVDVATRDMNVTEIIPYRPTENGRLKIYVHEGIPRAIVNAIQRTGVNLDGKRWSGHMTEAITIPAEILEPMDMNDVKNIVRFSSTYLGLKPVLGRGFEEGPGFYPAPDHIDERVQTRYLQVDAPERTMEPRIIPQDAAGFSTRGKIREIDAQDVLNAIAVGLIPSSRLEIQIMALYQKLGLTYQTWAESPLVLKEEEIPQPTRLQEIVARLSQEDHRYKAVRGTAGQIKTVKSVFVDEGQNDGGLTGLASREMEFALLEQESQNIAVVLPLTKNINGEVMAGITTEYLPVPQRYSKNGLTISCPSFPLPKEITNMELARKYIADVFQIPVTGVSRMGESFFAHTGLLPNRIYPFAVATAGVKGWRKEGRTHGMAKMTPLYHLHKMLYWDNHDSFMKVVGLAYTSTIGVDSDMSPSYEFSTKLSADNARPMGLRTINLSAMEKAPRSGDSLSPQADADFPRQPIR